MKAHYEVMPIIFIWILLGIYIFINALLINPYEEFSLTRADKLNGIMFCASVTATKVVELFRLRLFNIIIRLILIFLIYIVIYGLLGGPYMLVSFFQPFYRNVLAHFTILFLILEGITYYLQNRKVK